MSGFRKKDFLGMDSSEILGEIHGFVDERALNSDGASPEDIKEIKLALDAWCKDEFGVVPMELLLKRRAH